jgi:hypothetical protein
MKNHSNQSSGQPCLQASYSVNQKMEEKEIEQTTLHIHPGQVKGFNVDELEMEATRIVESTRVILEQKFGMQLSENGVPLHSPRWRVYRPECHE